MPSTRDLTAGSGLILEDAGEHELKACPTAGASTVSSPDGQERRT
jgi:hypothetical protein